MNELNQLFDLLKEKNTIDDKMEALKEHLANEIIPYKIDEVITICGYSHTGKKGKVTDKYIIIDREGIDLLVRVNVLRADGSVSNFKAVWKSNHDPILKEALVNALKQIV